MQFLGRYGKEVGTRQIKSVTRLYACLVNLMIMKLKVEELSRNDLKVSLVQVCLTKRLDAEDINKAVSTSIA